MVLTLFRCGWQIWIFLPARQLRSQLQNGFSILLSAISGLRKSTIFYYQMAEKSFWRNRTDKRAYRLWEWRTRLYNKSKTGRTIDEVLKAGWKKGVGWQDGRAFGGSCHIRMNLALPLSRIEDAFGRLKRYVFLWQQHDNEERKVNNIKTVIRESQWYLPDLFVLFRYMINIIPIALLLFR